MARDAYISTNRYAAKMLGSHLGRVFSNQHTQMVTNYATFIGEMCGIIDATKTVLHRESGVRIAQYPFYLVYAREVWKLRNNFGGNTLYSRLTTLRKKWTDFGLTPSILIRIEREVFGIVPPPTS
ncbi:MAG: hypothetical protein RMJ34_07445 [candidate division WOR-3 bacterium]|nr:hypothetical protein [candidate division WOR-3 bacterium]